MNWLTSLQIDDNQIAEIRNLESLNRLEYLYLSYNKITEIKNLENLRNLKNLFLHTNYISEIKNLENLTNLQRLDLSSNKISEIKNLENQKNLLGLDLFDNGVTEIKNLENLINLYELNLSRNPITDVSKLKDLVNLATLEKLTLYGITKNNLHIPAENFGKDALDNCLPLLKAYFEAVKKGATYIREVPVILVGNSTAGKTSLLHFIKQKEYPPPNDHSTHGIEPDLWQPPQAVLDEFPNVADLKGVQFYFWDFGGQEYYHATHRLFFSQAGVYVLVWDKQTNKQGVEKIPVRLEKADGGIEKTELPVELFPYTYWLDTIRFFAPATHDAPIVLVQNKLDAAGYKKDRPANDLFDRFGITESFHLSVQDANATKPNGKTGGKPFHDFEDFLEHLLTLAKGHALNLARQTHWHAVKGLLQQHKNENVLTTQQFLAYLRLIDPDINEMSMASYTGDLDWMGYIFYRPYNDELKNVIFINPAWVTETIYAVLDKETLAAGGVFNRQKAEAHAGKDHTPAFLALMKSFELIFEDPDGYFIAPQYLPAKLEDTPLGKKGWNKLTVRFNGFAAPDFYLRFPDFMPRSVMLRFLAAYGARAVGQTYWKNGIAFMLEGKEAVVLYDAASTGFKIFVEDGDKYVQRLITDTLLQLSGNKETLQIGLNLNDFVPYGVLREYALKSNEVKAVSGKWTASAPLRHFVELIDNVKRKAPKDGKRPIKVFVSYSHKDADYFKTFAAEFGEYMSNSKKYSFNTFDDRQLLLGSDWNDRLEEEVEACDVGILLFSAAFLNSDYVNEKELGPMLEKLESRKDFVICPVYFRPFEFAEFDFLKKYQFFKPDGAKYEQADKGTNLCFAHLVKFNNANGVNLPAPNSNRDEYLRDLSKALFKALDQKFQN